MPIMTCIPQATVQSTLNRERTLRNHLCADTKITNGLRRITCRCLHRITGRADPTPVELIRECRPMAARCRWGSGQIAWASSQPRSPRYCRVHVPSTRPQQSRREERDLESHGALCLAHPWHRDSQETAHFLVLMKKMYCILQPSQALRFQILGYLL